jgi:glycosyltransferase involved in cell wall biosynthesis
VSRHVLIEGWRGISHSYALVNQHQMSALLQRPEVTLSHRDLPFFRDHWNVRDNAAGLQPEQQAAIDAVPPPDGRKVDTIYRISFPPRGYGGNAEKIYCFSTLEYRMKPFFYEGEETRRGYPNDTVKIVTPSNWSKALFVASGTRPEDVIVIPHGIDPDAFRPLPAAERQAIRQRLGLSPDNFAFLNVSSMSAGKGIQTLLAAFSVVNERFPHTRLLLKDQPTLFKPKASRNLETFRRHHPDRPMRGLSIVSQNVPVAMLRQLYGACDAYVSPYRAEGFNLPPLEAAACGTPIVVTAGGPTDDYAEPSFALKIASKPGFEPGFGGCLEPIVDSLIDCMERLVTGRTAPIDMNRGSARVRARHAWASIAEQLVAIL